MSTTLHDLLARPTELEWFEAVAVVQALCKRLLDATPATGTRVPDLHEIILHADGTIEAAGEGPPDQSPVFRVGQLLMALVAGKPMPVPLRLLALTAVSPAPPYTSVGELTTALDYYERPDRTAIIRAVYERFEKLPATSQPAAAIEELPAAPPPQPVASPPRWWTLHPRVVIASVALLLVVSAALSWSVLRSKMPWLERDSRQVAMAVGATTDTIARTVSSGIQAVGVQLGLSDPTEARQEPPPPEPAPASAPSVPRRSPALLPSTGGWLTPGAPAVFLPPAVPTVALDHTTEPMVEPTPLPAPAVEPGEWTIYSTESLDVVPPTPVHAKLPSEPPPGVRPDSLPLLELVISASGEVESARLMTPSPSVPASMMVSAVKAWRFRPATRNGRPVRYRLMLRLTSQ
jgi:hypothetical protein